MDASGYFYQKFCKFDRLIFSPRSSKWGVVFLTNTSEP
ncbi:hypothetical protein MHA_2407 [Mannheimia haemolytica PHL213]|nr:hypothetical protein MHH_c07900 [Mannheimia haemolytica M42548]EDN75289.1 hypothetical protein MHA_2407 [Mannheimia haemolytica PHL213]